MVKRLCSGRRFFQGGEKLLRQRPPADGAAVDAAWSMADAEHHVADLEGRALVHIRHLQAAEVVEAARSRGDALDHVLFAGPPGLGKTTLAQIVARELGVGFRATSGPVISKAGDLAALLTNLEERDVLFIDEIHRFSKSQQDSLLGAVEQGVVVVKMGAGLRAEAAGREGLLQLDAAELQGALDHAVGGGGEAAESYSTRSLEQAASAKALVAAMSSVLNVALAAMAVSPSLRRHSIMAKTVMSRLRCGE